MDHSKSPSSHPSLQGTSNWNQWILIIKKLAVAEGVWQYLDPEAPNRPEFNEPIELIPGLVNPDATSIVDLDADDFKRFDFLTTQYRTRLQGYYRQKKAIASIQRHIILTIGNYYDIMVLEEDVAG
ncbi:hypothetical protein QQS21_008772 [Conoideocrella luteorostrata]|uniref:DUF4219 domain-containing protein n=1 Tax=Conoideocrella luteorostrata TaxID=1105319 RepID=A0AAJ0CI76_9HYPO|nr:hypothetical protein QQS21_008772 [Conoideocrella luteorostrata]